jgi:hypothetical protein
MNLTTYSHCPRATYSSRGALLYVEPETSTPCLLTGRTIGLARFQPSGSVSEAWTMLPPDSRVGPAAVAITRCFRFFRFVLS